jgi:hypothetical protein
MTGPPQLEVGVSQPTGRRNRGPDNRAGCSGRTPQKGHEIETNRDGHQLRQVATPLVGESASDRGFELTWSRHGAFPFR